MTMTILYKEHLNWIDPVIVARKLIEVFGEPGLIWLDGDGSQNGRWITLAADPLETIQSRGLPSNPSASNPFQLLRNIENGHWTGWLSYEAGAWIEPKNPWKEDSMATLWIARHDPVLKFDLHKNQLWLEGINKKRFAEILKLLQDLETPRNSAIIKQKNDIGIPISNWHWLTTKEEYKNIVATLKKYIQSGDIFQANLSACCKLQKEANFSSINIFERLRQSCPAPFSGIAIASGDAEGEAVLSTSPERFLKITANQEIETRPIKGTRPRNPNKEKDFDLAADLISSLKDRAENIMIVDLLRNDLGKVCQAGSIKVTQLAGLESYSKVHHLTSVIQGKLDNQKTWVDALEACWPGGSISGAPKIRACQRLYELEPIARGPYCGSLLHLNWDGEFDSNILIRSLMVDKSNLRIHAGCGIVADSDPNNESEELSWKLIPLLEALA